MIKLTGKVEDRGLQFLQKIAKQYARLNKSFVVAGWDRDAKYPTGQLVAQVALWNEFATYNEDGSLRTPARPFIRPAYQDNQAAIKQLRTQAMQDVADGKIAADKALERMGYQLQLFIQAKIKANPGPSLAESTLANKRAAGRPAVTLIDTRRMLDTCTYKVFIDGATPPVDGKPAPTGGGGTSSGGSRVPIPPMRTPDQIRGEKESLRDELKRAKKAKKDKAAPQTPKVNHSKGGGGRKKSAVKPKSPKPPGMPKPPKAPTPPKGPKRSPRKRTSRASKVIKPGAKRARSAVKKSAKRIKTLVKQKMKAARRSDKSARKLHKTLRKSIQKTAKRLGKSLRRQGKASLKAAKKITKAAVKTLRKGLKKQLRELKRLGKAQRSHSARAAGRAHHMATKKHGGFSGLEASLLHAIIHLSRKAGTYGRKLN